MRCARTLLVVMVAAAPLAAGDRVAAAEPAAAVDANGNPFTGGLGFEPERVTVRAGRTVEWTNTDFLVPHTATDDHGLWELSGDYGLPGLATGFGPGERVSRSFDAGRFPYFCVVHGSDAMHGVVKARPHARLVESGGEAMLRVSWGAGEPPGGQVFDVQRRTGGEWQLVRAGTREPSGLFPTDGGPLRARLRVAGDRAARSGWSPPAPVPAG